jgi:hypothetical protein
MTVDPEIQALKALVGEKLSLSQTEQSELKVKRRKNGNIAISVKFTDTSAPNRAEALFRMMGVDIAQTKSQID